MSIPLSDSIQKLIKDLDKRLVTPEDLADFLEEVVKMIGDIRAEQDDFVGMSRDGFDTFKKELTEEIEENRTLARFDDSEAIRTGMADLLAKIEAKMQEVDTRMELVRDGIDADEEVVAERAAEMAAKMIEIPEPQDLVPDLEEIRTRIQELSDKIDKLPKQTQWFTGGAASPREFIKNIDISAQLNGSDKTFNIHAVYSIVSVHCSSFPHALRPTIDYTWTPTSITFTSEIDAASTLASGQTVIITAIIS